MSAPAALSATVAAPPDLLLRLALERPADYPAFLDSVGSGPLARRHLLFRADGRRLLLDAAGRLHGERTAGRFLDAWRNWYRREQCAARAIATDDELPAWPGGWVVLLGYEWASELEPVLTLPPSPDPWVAAALFCPVRLSADPAGETITVSAPCEARTAFEAAVSDLQALKRGAPASAAARGDGAAGDLRLDRIEEEPPQAFLDAVRTAQRHIAAGDIYQANVSRLWRTRYTGPVAPIYRRLRAANPGPFAALVQLPGLVICSSSPERLLRLRGPELSTRPIAGTRPRSCAPDADALEIGALRASAKEQAEHVMLIDLERNDLGRVAVPGSVRVDEWMITESYRHVHHIVSNVRALLRPELDALAALAALFPGGTITGVPKIRCMQLIAQLESVGRGAYTGSVGYLGRDGHGDFNILIRTLVLAGGELRFRSGAGIVADSDPELELAETRAKARGLLAALGVAA